MREMAIHSLYELPHNYDMGLKEELSVKDRRGALGSGELGRRVLLWESLSEHRTVGFFPLG